MPAPTPPPVRSYKEVTNSVVRQLAAGRSQDLIVRQLIARGWPEVSARHFVANAAPNAREHLAADKGEERWQLAELYRRRLLRDVWLTLACVVVMLIVSRLFPSMTALALFFLSMTAFSFVDLIVALIGWMRNR